MILKIKKKTGLKTDKIKLLSFRSCTFLVTNLMFVLEITALISFTVDFPPPNSDKLATSLTPALKSTKRM